MSETALPAAQTAEWTREGRAEQQGLRVERLTAEAGWMLLTAGVVGVIVPGIAGTPFLVAGIFILLPGGAQLLSRWSTGNLPTFVRFGVRLVARLLNDLERRYPHTLTPRPKRRCWSRRALS
jgi:hypothetical protein